MMKRFFKSGKWIGLLVVGLLFAGCYDGGGSSSESAVATGVQSAVNAVAFNVDPEDHTLSFGEAGLGSAVVNINGHDVEIRNGTSVASGSTVGCTGTGMDMKCYIRVINRDPSMYMANAYLEGSGCVGCVSAQIDNADLSGGATVGNCVGTAGDVGCGGSVPIDGLGLCLVEDGQFKTQGSPHNEMGCNTHETASSGIKPMQVMHPDCGSVLLTFDFGNQGPKYTFFGSVVSDYFPWNPTSGDARYDFQDRSTYYMMVTALDEGGLYGGQPNTAAWINVGSYLRSTVLSGWNESGSNNLAAGTYFAVNTAIEYPDRIESQIMGDNMSNQDYEYYGQFGYVFRYNNLSVREVTASNLTSIGAYNVIRGARFHCTANQASAANAACNAGWQPYTGLGALTYGTTSDYRGNGWIALAVEQSSNFAYLAVNYTTFGGNVIANSAGGTATMSLWASPSAYQIAPLMNGHYGVANIDPALTIIQWNNGGAYTPGQILQQGPDVAPEFPIAVYYFQAMTPDTGSEFWVDVMSSASGLKIRHTNGTLYPSGTKAGNDDWGTMCSPQTAGSQGCGPEPQITFDVFAGLENVNLNIGHSGAAAYGGLDTGGAMQQWPAHVCVQ